VLTALLFLTSLIDGRSRSFFLTMCFRAVIMKDQYYQQ